MHSPSSWHTTGITRARRGRPTHQHCSTAASSCILSCHSLKIFSSFRIGREKMKGQKGNVIGTVLALVACVCGDCIVYCLQEVAGGRRCPLCREIWGWAGQGGWAEVRQQEAGHSSPARQPSTAQSASTFPHPQVTTIHLHNISTLALYVSPD